MPRPLFLAIVSAVTVLWITNVVVGFFDPARAYPGLNWIFTFIVGGAMAADKPVRMVMERISKSLSPPDGKGEETP